MINAIFHVIFSNLNFSRKCFLFKYKVILFKEKSRLNTFMAGLGAGVVEATLVVTPAETLKVKLIHDRFQPVPKYNGLFHGISTIVKNQGIGGCYKGLFPTILKQGSNQGVRFLVYEDTKKFTSIIKKNKL